MTNEEKILQLLAEMQTEIKNIKAEISALRPHVESKAEFEARRRRLTKLLTENDPITPEELAEVDELERRIKENRRLNAIAAAENAGLKVIYSDDDQSTDNTIIDAGRRVAS
ncbi:MAG: hypothetical protein IJS69_04710 [Selenomonadaceae bacterium]|nr:hypothetical protein [Selenomonadaceae bacterium]